MTAVFPVKGPINDFCGGFIDESVGFAVRWMAWFAYCVLAATEISVVAQTFNFSFPVDYLKANHYPLDTLGWTFGQETSSYVWIGLTLIVILLTNLLPVRLYGGFECYSGCIKIFMMVPMILFNVIVSGINANNGTAPGQFWTYQEPYGFFTNKFAVAAGNSTLTFFGDSGRPLALWTATNTVFFPVQGFFVVSVTAAENQNLETDETVKLARQKIALRVLILYALLVFTVGLNVPYDDQMLVDSAISSIRQGNHSPFIGARIRSGVKGLPHVFNAFFIFSAFSVAVNGLYVSSRLLHASASIRNVWPEWAYFIKIRLKRTTSKGVPIGAVVASWFVAFLSLLRGRSSPAKILGRLAVITTSSMLIVYICVSVAFLYFKPRCTIEAGPMDPVAMKSDLARPVLSRAAANYPYRTHLQWACATFALVACFLFLFFNGWKSFLSPFSSADFIASYIAIPSFVILVPAYHVKDERTWNPAHWTRRATMNVQNPIETKHTEPLLRRGRLHRANIQRLWVMENMRKVVNFIWVWMK